MTHSEKRTHWVKEGTYALITGTLYGATCIAVGHPFDTIKTKMQAQASYIEGGGLFKTLVKIVRKEGFVGLWRGWLPPLFGSSIYRSTQFAVYEALYTKWHSDEMRSIIPFSGGIEVRVVAAGFSAATCRAIIESPIEYAKVKRQTGQTWYLKNVYTGFKMQWVRTGGLMTIYFMMIDSIRRHTDLMHSKLGQFFASGFSSVVGFWIVWPFETIKNQLQAETKNVGNTFRERVSYLTKTHGAFGLFRGIVPGTASIFLRNGVAMIVMQWAQKQLTLLGLLD